MLDNSNYLDEKFSQIDDHIERLQAERRILIEKGMGSSDPISLVRANSELRRLQSTGQFNIGQSQGGNAENQKSYIFDPNYLYNNMGYKDRPITLSYDIQRVMAKAPLIRAVINTRLSQINNFSVVSSDDNSVGWRIRKKPSIFGGDKDNELSDADKKRIEFITNFLINCGNDNNEWVDDTFETFLQKFNKDSLELDQATFELVRSKRGDLVKFLVTDAATYRYASTHINDEDYMRERARNGHLPAYVQIYNGQVWTDFYPWELCFGIRNLTTDIRNSMYGISELEDLVQVVTWMLNGDQYNGNFFTNGAAPKGILKVAGNVSPSALQEFRGVWQHMVAGVKNAWRVPVLEGDKIEFIDLQKTNQDMQFGNWQEYLIRTSCAVYKIDPTEVGYVIRGGGGGGDAYASHKQRTDYSKDKGLFPLLKFNQAKINKFIVSQIDKRYEFVFTGISPQDEQEQMDLDAKRITNINTINEVRVKRGLQPLEGCDIIMNPIAAQYMSMANGDPDSDEAMRDEYGDENPEMYEDSPFEEKEESVEKSNPIIKDLNDWIRKGAKQTLEFDPDKAKKILRDARR
jgi:hypothetical protein